MKAERFKELLDELDGNSLQTLKEKNGRYAQNGDCLHNFKKGAIINRRTPAQTCWGYMSKHLVALMDMVERDDFSNREDFLEKCQDTINYIRFLWCIGNDNVSMHMPKPEIIDKERLILNAIYNDRNFECQYAEYDRYGDRVCLGTKEKDLCPGYAKCGSYKPIKDKEKEND